MDIALVTRMNNFTGGLVVRQEHLVWIVGEQSQAQFEDPLRLALLPPGNIYREHAIGHLERAGRKWQIACVSESVSGLQAAVFAGMAVTVLGRCALVPGMRELTVSEGFPTLPKIDLLLYKAPGASSPAIDALHDYLAHYVGLTAASVEEATDVRQDAAKRAAAPNRRRRAGAASSVEFQARFIRVAAQS